MGNWTFDIEDEGRRATLLAPTTFKAIVAQIHRDMKILCAHRDACLQGPIDHARSSHAEKSLCHSLTCSLMDLTAIAQHIIGLESAALRLTPCSSELSCHGS